VPLHLKKSSSGQCNSKLSSVGSHFDLLGPAELLYFAVGMRTNPLVFDVEIFLEGNLLLLTPVDRAETAAEVITHAIATPSATISAAIATTMAILATITVTVAVRLERKGVNKR